MIKSENFENLKKIILIIYFLQNLNLSKNIKHPLPSNYQRG